MKKTTLLFCALLLTLTGCIGFHNYTPSDIRQPELFYKKAVATVTLAGAIAAVEKYQQLCGPLTPITVDPVDPAKAFVVGYAEGWTKAAASVVIDFEQLNETQTRITAYAYRGIAPLAKTRGYADIYFGILRNPANPQSWPGCD